MRLNGLSSVQPGFLINREVLKKLVTGLLLKIIKLN